MGVLFSHSTDVYKLAGWLLKALCIIMMSDVLSFYIAGHFPKTQQMVINSTQVSKSTCILKGVEEEVPQNTETRCR